MENEKQHQPWTVTGRGTAGVTGPVEGSVRYASSSAAWQPTESKGFWVKPLFDDPQKGEKTMLMKVDPGAYSPLHTHPGEFEQIYVLEGSFYDRDMTLGLGDYCCRAPGTPHEAGSTSGAIVLLVYTKA